MTIPEVIEYQNRFDSMADPLVEASNGNVTKGAIVSAINLLLAAGMAAPKLGLAITLVDNKGWTVAHACRGGEMFQDGKIIHVTAQTYAPEQ
ncbi:MAG: hypothetical protein V4486_01185 [Patescibacteria group bacterium]